MPRYIDADALMEKIIKCEFEITGCGIMYHAGEVQSIINFMPTADVVPKSEYDEVLSNWQKIHDSYTADCIRHYDIGRQEAASEIFAEIESVMYNRFSNIMLGEDIRLRIAELKKKYAESGKSKREKIFDDLVANSAPYVDKDDETVFFCIKSKTFKQLKKKYTEVSTDEVQHT